MPGGEDDGPAAAPGNTSARPLGKTAHAVDERVLEPYRYIAQTPGKDIRGALVDCFQAWLGVPAPLVAEIKTIVSYLHDSSLLIDDIEDDSQLRRGKPVAHAIFGVPMTLNTANYVYFIALARCDALDNRAAMRVFVEELLNLHRGQGQDILWRDTNACPTEAEYERMVLDKTGGLFRLAVGLMAAFSPLGATKQGATDGTAAAPTTASAAAAAAPPAAGAFRPLVDLLALYFQIRDDLVNLRSDEYMHSKSFCEDLTEGKFSFPIIRAVRARPDDTRLLNILKQRTTNVDVKRHAVDFMESVGAFDHTRDRLRAIRRDIDAAIAALGGHDTLTALIDRLDRQIFDDPQHKRAAAPEAKTTTTTTPGAAAAASRDGGGISAPGGAAAPGAAPSPSDTNRVKADTDLARPGVAPIPSDTSALGLPLRTRSVSSSDLCDRARENVDSL